MVEFIICLLITVFVHELAHMIVALWVGMGVTAFSIGFGKPYLHKTIKGIDFRLSPFLLGGYCDIQGMESKKSPKDFLNHPYRNKFAVIIAGVTANFILAFICYLIQYKSILFGIYVDWTLVIASFTNDFSKVPVNLNWNINFFLIQLSMLNLFCGITNLLPIPALDGGHLWMVLMEPIWKEKFIARYTKITHYFFIGLIIFQIILLLWCVIFWR